MRWRITSQRTAQVVDAFDPPGEADRGVGRDYGCRGGRIVAGRCAAEDDVEGRVGGALGANEGDDLGKIGRRHDLSLFPIDPDLIRKDAIQPRRAVHRPTVRPGAANPDRYARALHRTREECRAFDLVERALEVHRLAAHQSEQNLDAFVEFARAHPRARILAECREVTLRWLAETNAQDEPAVRQVVQGDRFPSDLPGTAPRQRRDQRADPNVRGDRCDGREGDPGIDDRQAQACLGLEVVPEKETVPAAPSASWANSTRRRGSPYSPKFGRCTPYRKVASPESRWVITVQARPMASRISSPKPSATAFPPRPPVVSRSSG